jgi:hypothetical protein
MYTPRKFKVQAAKREDRSVRAASKKVASLPITVSLTDYDVSFTHDMEAMLLTLTGLEKDLQPLYRIPLGEDSGPIELVLDADDPDLLIVRHPTGLSSTFWAEYLILEGQFKAMSFDKTLNRLWAGGIGIIDILDTDPQHVELHELPLAGTGTYLDPVMGNIEVQFLGVVLQVSRITSLNVGFDDSAWDFETATVNPRILRFISYYSPIV